MPIITFNPTDFVYNAGEITISGSALQLLLQSGLVDFTENFDNDTGFTYDNTKSEFSSGKLQQKDNRPANSILGATYTNTEDLSFAADGFGSLSANISGGAAVSGGKLVCDGAGVGVYYSSSLIGDLSGNLVLKFKYTPTYSTAPPTNVNIVTFAPVSGTSNRILIFHSPAGNSVRITANGLSAVVFDTWEPVAETEYTFEVIINSNSVTLFIDGVQLGGSKTISPGQGTDAVCLYVGSFPGTYNESAGSFDNVILYSAASQSASYIVPEAAYLETNVVLPELQHVGDGAILSFEEFVTVESGTPRYTLQIGRSGNYLYWNGAVWAVSDGTYAQSNSASIFNSNVSTLPVSGEIYGQFKIHFETSNTQSFVDTLTATLIENTGYLTTNPSAVSDSFRTDTINSFESVETKAGLDEIKYVFLKDGVQYWHNGVDWVVSNSTYAESNTLTEVQNNIPAFLDSADGGKNIKVEVFFHSDDGSTTPSLESLTIDYSFAGEPPSTTLVTIWGYLRDLFSYAEDETIQVRPAWTIGDKIVLKGDYKSIVSLTSGYFEINCYIEENHPPEFLFWKIGTKTYKTNFLNQSSVKIGELTILEESRR